MMLAQSASVTRLFEILGADATDEHPRMLSPDALFPDHPREGAPSDTEVMALSELPVFDEPRRPRIKQVRPPSYERASRVFADALRERPTSTSAALPARPPRPAPQAQHATPLALVLRSAPPPLPAPPFQGAPPLPFAPPPPFQALPFAPPLPFAPRATFDSLEAAVHTPDVARSHVWTVVLSLAALGLLAVLGFVRVHALHAPPARALVVATPRAPSVTTPRELIVSAAPTAPRKARAWTARQPRRTAVDPLRSP